MIQARLLFGHYHNHPAAERYDKCIRSAFPGWHVALYPPLPVGTFGIGTIFSRFQEGSIRTYPAAENVMVDLL
jgi:hypothetical protein